MHLILAKVELWNLQMNLELVQSNVGILQNLMSDY